MNDSDKPGTPTLERQTKSAVDDVPRQLKHDTVPTPMTVKDFAIANVIEAWHGDTSKISIVDFLSQVDNVGALGNWTDNDKIRIISLRLKGSALTFFKTCPLINKANVTYGEIKNALIERFSEKVPDQYYYTALQTTTQRKGETPEQFADRLRNICEKTIRKTNDQVEQRILHEEAEHRLLAAYLAGLQGELGQQIRFRFPTTMMQAVQLAVTVSNTIGQTASSTSNRIFSTQAKFSQPTNKNQKAHTCYNFNKVGHIAKDCRAKKRDAGDGKNTKFENKNGNNISSTL